MIIRRKVRTRGAVRGPVSPLSVRQEAIRANLRRFNELAMKQAVGGAAAAQTSAPAPAPAPPKVHAPVGEVIPPDREGKAVSPATRLAEANRHVRNSVHEARTIIRQSGRLFVREHTVSDDPGAAARRVTEETASGVGRAGQSVQDAIAFAMGGAPVRTPGAGGGANAAPHVAPGSTAAAAAAGSQ